MELKILNFVIPAFSFTSSEIFVRRENQQTRLKKKEK